MNNKALYSVIKRLFDVVLSILSIIILAIPMIAVAIAIKVDSRGPVLFMQKRIGKDKKTFKILKFRSMYCDTDPNAATHLLNNADSHITKVGKIIRKMSIDEIPQLFNIFVGKMSFVGPRPALWNQYDLIAERDKYNANSVKPGLTGWAQINGRDEVSIEEKAVLDGEYVARRGMLFDMKILFKTFFSVIKHKGVAEGGVKK